MTLIATVALLGAFASISDAVLIQHGDLFVTFNGGIAPDRPAPPNARPDLGQRLRHGQDSSWHHTPAPAPDRDRDQPQRPPRNRRPADLPRRPDRRDHLRSGPSRLPRRTRRHRHLLRSGLLPRTGTFPSQGHILAFNALSEGRPVILAHVYGTSPAPSTGVITFYIQHLHGAYGTELNDIPASFSKPLKRLRQAHRPHPAPHLHLSWPPP